jgi:ABC-2 type transport system permease protein
MASEAITNNKFKKNWHVLTALVSKDFKRKYRRSVLGVVWSVLNPLLMMVVLAAVFSFLFNRGVENYPLYLILGNILYNLMRDATNQGMHSIVGSASLIKKIHVEKAIFPIEKVVFELVNFAFSLIAVALVMFYFQVAPTWHLVFLPVLLVFVVLFSAGLSMLLAALAVFFRDMFHLWNVFTMAWMYATPILYPLDILAPWMQQVMQFNPMYHFITFFRDIVMWSTVPPLQEFGICAGMAIVTFLVGLLVFRKTQHKFILYV